MATCLDKLENKVQFHRPHVKRFHMVQRLRKLIQHIRWYLTKYAEPRREHATQFPTVSLFSAETTGPIFTKILHFIVALVALLNHAYTWRYPIPFLNAWGNKGGVCHFFSQNWLPWRYLILHIRGVRSFCFRTQEQRVKVVDFHVCQNAPKLIGYHRNIP